MVVYHRVTQEELYRFAYEVFRAAGASEAAAKAIAYNLTQGELHGMGSHGVSRLMPVYVERLRNGGTNPDPQIKVLQRRKSTAIVDGDGGAGAQVALFAMGVAIDIAREEGTGWVAVRNSSHFGAAFITAREALKHDMIGVATTASIPLQPPYGGRARALGTNPLCWCIPGGKQGDVIFDMATTVVAKGKLLLAIMEGKPIPEGWALDEEGRPTTDPVAADKGVMLPLGGPKGYGLAMIAEIFSSILTGAEFGPRINNLYGDTSLPQKLGHFLGAIDVAAFMPPERFRARMDELIEFLRSIPLAPGHKEILIPGELERRKAEEYSREGIPIAEDVVASHNKIAADLGVRPLQTQPPH
ncbi:MAG: Ldh family oxidoreductase [Chloroflexi bacterium]|nr:Ldh family oxidoreductase [Chloroflexota bacterium]